MTIPSQTDGLVTIGQVVGVYGVKGWLKIHSYTRPREAIFAYQSWFLGQSETVQRETVKTYRLLQGRPQAKGLVAELETISDRDQASTLIGASIAVQQEALAGLSAGEYYWRDLEGLRVEDSNGQELGTVHHLFETGANDVLVVVGDKERFIPYINSVVEQVDLQAGVIKVNWDRDF